MFIRFKFASDWVKDKDDSLDFRCKNVSLFYLIYNRHVTLENKITQNKQVVFFVVAVAVAVVVVAAIAWVDNDWMLLLLQNENQTVEAKGATPFKQQRRTDGFRCCFDGRQRNHQTKKNSPSLTPRSLKRGWAEK